MFLKRSPSNLYVEYAFRMQNSPAIATTSGMLIKSARYTSVKRVVIGESSSEATHSGQLLLIRQGLHVASWPKADMQRCRLQCRLRRVKQTQRIYESRPWPHPHPTVASR